MQNTKVTNFSRFVSIFNGFITQFYVEAIILRIAYNFNQNYFRLQYYRHFQQAQLCYTFVFTHFINCMIIHDFNFFFVQKFGYKWRLQFTYNQHLGCLINIIRLLFSRAARKIFVHFQIKQNIYINQPINLNSITKISLFQRCLKNIHLF